MKAQVFTVLKDFHLALIRKAPSELTISNAKLILVNGETITKQEGRNARKFEENLLSRQKDLIDFKNGDWDQKCEVYNRIYDKNPKQGVFDALKFVLYNNEVPGVAARECDVNLQCVKSLRTRFEFYIDTSVKLDKASN